MVYPYSLARGRRGPRSFSQIFSWRLVLTLALGLVVLAGSWWFINHPRWRLRAFLIGGTRAIPESSLAAVAAATLQGDYFGLLAKAQTFTYPKKDLARQLLDQFPRLAVVESAVARGGVLLLDVEEREPAYLWCSTNCYLQDESGVIFATAPQFSRSVFFIFRGEFPPPTLGSSPWPPDLFAELKAIPDAVARLLDNSPLAGFRPAQLAQTAAGDWQLWIQDKTNPGPGWIIIFSGLRRFDVELANLATTLSSDSFRADWEASSGSLEYLDLRFGDKVFYKYN